MKLRRCSALRKREGSECDRGKVDSISSSPLLPSLPFPPSRPQLRLALLSRLTYRSTRCLAAIPPKPSFLPRGNSNWTPPRSSFRPARPSPSPRPSSRAAMPKDTGIKYPLDGLIGINKVRFAPRIASNIYKMTIKADLLPPSLLSSAHWSDFDDHPRRAQTTRIQVYSHGAGVCQRRSQS